MANTIEYIFSLQDKISAKVGNITITSDRMLGRFADLEKKTLSVNKTFNETGRTVGALKEKVALLQAEREWIPASNLNGIKSYNREITKLNKEITKLENVDGGKIKQWGKEAFSSLPGANFIANPLVAGAAAAAFMGKEAMNFDEGMAKVNITAQLDNKSLIDLKSKLKKMVRDNKADIGIAPVGLEKIISQVGDLDMSMQILDATLKGSKAGFTDMDTVSKALAQSMSTIGKGKASAMEVLDVFFAAKRVGAGEFADYAKYMPTLIAGASNMGIAYKEVAGVFAYMTGKGQSAERAAVLMENAFSVLGRGEVRAKLEKSGVNVFDDQGKIRSMLDIFKDLSGVMSTMSGEQKSTFLEKIGLVDKEAKNAFAIMTSDLDKLKIAMDATGNATGETGKALGFSQNSVQKATEVWNQFKQMATALGEYTLPVIGFALDALRIALMGVNWIIETICDFFNAWFDRLNDGSPLIWGVTVAVSALTASMLVNYICTNAMMIATKALTVLNAILTAKTWLLNTAQWAWNAAISANPIGAIIALVAGLIAVVVVAWQKVDWFRGVIYACWEAIKGFGILIKDYVIDRIKGLLSGVSGLGDALLKLFNGDFSGAFDSAKQAVADLVGVDAFKNAAGNFHQIGYNMAGAYQQGFEDFYAANGDNSPANAPGAVPDWSKNPGDISPNLGFPNLNQGWVNTGKEIPGQTPGKKEIKGASPAADDAATAAYDKLMKELAKNKKGTKSAGSTKTVLNLNEEAADRKETADYTSAVRKLSPVAFDLKPAVTAPAAGKVNPSRPLLATTAKTKVDNNKQEYAPDADKSNYVHDIMMNVRRIAAVAAVPLAMNLAGTDQLPAATVPDIPVQTVSLNEPSKEVYTVEKSERITERNESNSLVKEGRDIHVDRVCDSVVIHVANTDRRGEEEIRNKILDILDEISFYEA